MNVSAIYMVTVPLLIMLSYITFRESPARGRAKKGLSPLLEAAKDTHTDEIFENVGIKLSITKYSALRNFTLMFLGLFILALNFTGGETKNMLFIAVAFSIITYPKEKTLNKKTPFKMILDLIRKNYLAVKDAELLSVVSQMKNLAVTYKDSPLSSVHMLINLMRFTKISKPIFAHTISLLMRNETKGAYQYFSKSFGTELGESFATIILKLDELDPVEFLDQIEIYQISVRERHKTKRLRDQENKSNILFLLASVPIMLIIMNFVMMVLGNALILL